MLLGVLVMSFLFHDFDAFQDGCLWLRRVSEKLEGVRIRHVHAILIFFAYWWPV